MEAKVTGLILTTHIPLAQRWIKADARRNSGFTIAKTFFGSFCFLWICEKWKMLVLFLTRSACFVEAVPIFRIACSFQTAAAAWLHPFSKYESKKKEKKNLTNWTDGVLAFGRTRPGQFWELNLSCYYFLSCWRSLTHKDELVTRWVLKTALNRSRVEAFTSQGSLRPWDLIVHF